MTFYLIEGVANSDWEDFTKSPSIVCYSKGYVLSKPSSLVFTLNPSYPKHLSDVFEALICLRQRCGNFLNRAFCGKCYYLDDGGASVTFAILKGIEFTKTPYELSNQKLVDYFAKSFVEAERLQDENVRLIKDERASGYMLVSDFQRHITDCHNLFNALIPYTSQITNPTWHENRVINDFLKEAKTSIKVRKKRGNKAHVYAAGGITVYWGKLECFRRALLAVDSLILN